MSSTIDLTMDRPPNRMKRPVFEVQNAFDKLSVWSRRLSHKRSSSWIDLEGDDSLEATPAKRVVPNFRTCQRRVTENSGTIPFNTSKPFSSLASSSNFFNQATLASKPTTAWNTPQRDPLHSRIVSAASENNCIIIPDEDAPSRKSSTSSDCIVLSDTPIHSRRSSTLSASSSLPSSHGSSRSLSSSRDFFFGGTKDDLPETMFLAPRSNQDRPNKRPRKLPQVIDPLYIYDSDSDEAQGMMKKYVAEQDNDSPDLMIFETFPVRSEQAMKKKTHFANSPQRGSSSITIDLEDETGHVIEDDQRLAGFCDGDFLTDEQCAKALKKLSLENKAGQRRKSSIANAQLKQEAILSTPFENSTLTPGKSVEMYDGSFLQIETIFKTETGTITLVGKYMVRQNYQGAIMPKRRNELVWIIEKTKEQFLSDKSPEMKAVCFSQVKCIRQITLTNRRYPEMSLKDHPHPYRTATEQVNEGPLFCRWKRETVKDTRIHIMQVSLSQLSFDEADMKTRGRSMSPKAAPAKLRTTWRECETIRGGSHVDVQVSHNLDGETATKYVHKYTFGDSFCGAGGTSRGALDAGLQVKWGFDMDPAAISSYEENFAKHGTECLLQSVDVFLCHKSIIRRMVDVAHFSPPCQPFSPAHTIPNEARDEANQAALFSVWHLLQGVKPRVATLEETEGLLNRHSEWFSALINIIVSLGYSVRWTVLGCREHGVPQSRKRLCLVASGPGEQLPHFPSPTHGEPGSGLRSFVTINDKIGDIPRNATYHDFRARFPAGPRPAHSGHTFAKTITCNGGVGNYHPSGLRNYTVREVACLQTFPICHSFGNAGVTAARRQVGNAVPPVLAKAVFRSIIQSLQETDRLGL